MFITDDLNLTSEMLALIAEIDEFKGAWRAVANMTPDRLSTLRRVATIESIGSSTRIEGSRLSDREVEELLAGLEIKTFDTRDAQEVAGYAEAMELVFQSWEQIGLTENHIRQLHRDLLQYSDKDEHHRGSWKTQSNTVAAFDEYGKQLGVVFETASPFDTPRLMAEVTDWARATLETRRLHSLLVIAIFTVVFLEIHPFQDGNGRLSRILTTLLLLRAGYSYVPYTSLESIIERNKERYYLSLRQTQRTIRSAAPDWQPWLLFFLNALHEQMRKLAAKIEVERRIFSPMPLPSLKILEQVSHHGRITIGEMAALSGINQNTLKRHFRQLVESGHLALYGAGRGAWYSLALAPK